MCGDIDDGIGSDAALMTDSTESYEKVPFAFGDQLLTGRDGTPLCSAGPEWYRYLGIIDTEASTWHQRLDDRRSPLGASQHKKRKKKC